TDELMEGVNRVSLVGGTLEVDADTDELGDALREFMEVSMRASLEQSGYFDDDEIDDMIEETVDEQLDYMLRSLEDELPLEVDFADTWDEQLGAKEYAGIDEDDALIGQGYPLSVITVDEGGWYTIPVLTVADLIAGEHMIYDGYVNVFDHYDVDKIRSQVDE